MTNDTRPVEFHLFKTLFSYSFFIIVFPIATFFVTKFFILDGMMNVSNVASNVYSAAASVIVLHIALGLYIWKAYQQDSPDKGKQD